MNKKILIAYFTKGGASKEYAEVIAETLKTNQIEVETYDLSEEIPHISDFDTIILGTGVRMFRVYRKWKKLLKHKELDKKNLFVYLASGTAIEEPDKAVEKFLRPIMEKYNLKPKSMISFPGKIPEKWAKLDNQEETIKPEIAKEWAMNISNIILD